jgi:preprotein translocase subunit YajC
MASQRLDSADAPLWIGTHIPKSRPSPTLATRRNIQTVNLEILLPLILIVGVMFMMNRSVKNKQRQAEEMRGRMEPGTGVRTIGGMYAVVKEVNDETVLLEITDGVQAHFAKSAIGTVLAEDEFNRIVHGIEPDEADEADGVEGSQDAEGEAAAAVEGAEDAPAALARTSLSKDGSDDLVDLGKPQDDVAEETAEQDGAAERAVAGRPGGSAAK